MEKLIQEANELVEREYGRAGARYGLTNHSDHESYAIILEELQEAKDEVDAFERGLSGFGKMGGREEDGQVKLSQLVRMYRNALFGACELIQVAAMAKKAAMTVCERGAVRELKEGVYHE